ncbi:LOW QUALITY PROTEIN: rho GTPase-activating protein 21-A [Gouania willdenowi]|uniref:LOW QUALITY PROTEIN: rho GTPase-activating protein 21-A n=1 Tax=Gouania willdenowi TaxID=441366 RepID=UPI00105495CA|nr:LOW QUALITY PROTEIN: rho GTPase-activating protein 21-A-like [Gouania willdenowi]
MMTSRWVPPPDDDDDERLRVRSSFCESDFMEWRSGLDAPAALSLFHSEDETFSWPRPKTLRLRRTSQGFGFTLRHFIVYPPESSLHCFTKEDDGRTGRTRNRLQPMDTIFVKQVKEGGPAHGAGLCTGDRIVKVNGASIIGKAYCEVISLIQDSGNVLDLCVMPKDEDILQLAYSQDAYLHGQRSYSGTACHIPEPPPVCYPRIDCKPPGMAQATELAAQVGRGPPAPPDHWYRKEVPVPPSVPPKSQTTVCVRNEGVRTVVIPPNAAHKARISPAQRIDFVDPAFNRARPASLAQYPHPRKADVCFGDLGMIPHGGQVPSYLGVHPNIDWRTYQTYKEYIDNKGIHSHGSRTIQERLDNFRAPTQNFGAIHHIPKADWVSKGVRRRSTSHERTYHGPPPPHFHMAPRSASQDRMSVAEMNHGRNWAPRSVSQDGLVHHARSTDYGESSKVSRPIKQRVYACTEQGMRPSRQSMPRHAMLYRPSTFYNRAPKASFYSKGDPLQSLPSPVPSGHYGRGSSTEHSFSEQRVAVKVLASNHSQGMTRAETMKPPETRDGPAAGQRSSSCSTPKDARQRPGILKPPPPVDSRSALNGQSPTECGVVLREKPSPGKHPSPLRQPSYILAVNEEGSDHTADVAACWLPNDARREMHIRRLEEQRHNSCSSNLDESLDLIPFIDEPVSPSVDREAVPIPPSAVISVAPSITSGPSSQGSPCLPIRRQLSHDQESLRSALLESDSTNKTERSKSYDEGLDTYQEVRGRSSSKHLPGLRGLRKALDGHKSSDSGSPRDSSSDVFTDSTKEGLLNFRQLSTDKNKRVGGGLRSWKQMYSVLQGHTLTLYKDRKDAVTHGDEEPLHISVTSCLIDISYSDTRRKNVLRLTTSDHEYLFQAENRDDMLSWIRVIQDSSSPDEENSAVTSQELISRKIREYNLSAPNSRSEPSPKPPRHALSLKQAFLGTKTEAKVHSPHTPRTGEERRDDSSPPRDRGAWKMGIAGMMRKPFEKKPPAGVTFGVRLDDCPPAHTNRLVPLIVEVCCQVVEGRGLDYTGIYRVPGNKTAISNMQEELNIKGLVDVDTQEEKWRDLNVISSLLKSFFRELPEPLFTNEMYADFIQASRTEDSVERLKELKRLVYLLPDHHFQTLKFLCAHLKKVSDNCEKNKMEPRNLAIMFGPTLVRTSEDNMANMVNHMPDQCKIIENLIQQHDWFFSDQGDEEPAASVEQENTVQSQPVPNIDHLLSNIGRTTASPSEVSDSACSDSSKPKGLWGSGRDHVSREMLRSSFFANRKRKKSKDKTQLSSSDDDLDSVLVGEELQAPPTWSSQKEEVEGLRRIFQDQLDTADAKEAVLPESPTSPPSAPALPQRPPSEPPSACDDTVSDLGTMNSTCSQASAPRGRRGRAGPDVCSITSDYSTTSSATFLTAALSMSESRGDDADDERSELVSEGRPVDTDSEGELSLFAVEREEPRPLSSYRLIEGDTLSRKKTAQHKTDSESSLDANRTPHALEPAQNRSTGSLSSSSRSELDKAEPTWKLKITDRLKVRLRVSADDMFGVGSQRTPEGRSKKKNIRRRHTMGGQRDFAELSVLGVWSEEAGLSAVDRLKPKCSSQDFSIREWIARERHRTSNPEVSLEPSEAQGATHATSITSLSASCSSERTLNGDAPLSKNLSLSATAHPHKLTGSQVVHSRFYQCL